MDAILFVDDDEGACALVAHGLMAAGFLVVTTTSPFDALDRLSAHEFSVVVTDLAMSEMNGIELCTRVREIQPDIPVVVLTGQGSLETAVQALRAGAFDFTTKPIDLEVLRHVVARAVSHRALHRELVRLKQVGPPLDGLVATSRPMKRVREFVSRIAASSACVLLQGECGTGKERVARAIHETSTLEGPFFVLPARALSRDPRVLLPPAAARERHVEAAPSPERPHGTVLLRDVDELSLEDQARLLDALRVHGGMLPVRNVAESAPVPFRVLSSTHIDLEASVYDKRFREDLFYRLNVVELRLPPLRERSSDILELTDLFLRGAATRLGRATPTLSPQAAERILNYPFPGNVRELESSIDRAVSIASFNQITAEDLPQKIREHAREKFVLTADAEQEVVSLDVLEKRYVRRVVELVGGNKTIAANLLGLDRRTMYRKLQRFEVEDQMIESQALGREVDPTMATPKRARRKKAVP